MHPGARGRRTDAALEQSFAIALRQDLVGKRGTAKLLMRWTGAGERTVKLWKSGKQLPDVTYLLKLVRESDAIYEWLTTCAGRS